MLFNSLTFLYLFLPVTLGVFWCLRSPSARYAWLTVTGYVFYSFWDYRFCALMAFSTLVSYLAGLGLLTFTTPGKRRLCLIVPISIDLLLLAFFKYVDFGLESLASLSQFFSLPVDVPTFSIVLPVGISFYTFHTITYIVDSYRGVITPTRNLFEFSCYVSLFAQLVAGPIVRFRQVEADLAQIGGECPRHDFNTGWSFFALGLAKKVLIADSLALMINPALEDYASLSCLTCWLCLLGYSYQLYFDFSGYSDMAVGLGYLFGIRLPQNFNSPYKAEDIADFWRRWHISLSSCLRDYLYIPLGGNRGSELATYRNLMLTMLLGGLWHGANWTFVLWGGYHGLLLGMHKVVAGPWSRLPLSLRRGLTFLLVIHGWLLFRATDLDMASSMLVTMWTGRLGELLPWTAGLLIALALAAVIAHGCRNTFEMSHNWGALGVTGLCVLFLLSLLVIMAGPPSPFLYFQF